eukprot:TRINITY_DN782_c0_g1_i1.p1 TRINITY_DN782_c0_g1~~TRINITY_DN782_c0_g1_i1.p1  ORF type:complete len:770 (-),score=202.62 TRINITY_DN782_c0_g1_i1:67-2265(-)
MEERLMKSGNAANLPQVQLGAPRPKLSKMAMSAPTELTPTDPKLSALKAAVDDAEAEEEEKKLATDGLSKMVVSQGYQIAKKPGTIFLRDLEHHDTADLEELDLHNQTDPEDDNESEMVRTTRLAGDDEDGGTDTGTARGLDGTMDSLEEVEDVVRKARGTVLIDDYDGQIPGKKRGGGAKGSDSDSSTLGAAMLAFQKKPPPAGAPASEFPGIRYVENVYEFYDVDGELGSGSYGTVVCAKEKATGRQFAVKVMPITAEDSINFMNEYRVLKHLHELSPDNKYLMHFHEAVRDSKNFYLICELLRGPMLFDYIMTCKNFSEKVASAYVAEILEGLLFLHSNSIVHRDLKPENLMFSNVMDDSKAGDWQIKIIDFGCAIEVSKFTRNTVMAGTPWYLAPEMLLSPVTRSVSVVSATKDVKFSVAKKQAGVEICLVDMWSVGVIVFFMLTGRLPFDGPTRTQVYQAICKGLYEYPEDIELSDNAKDFIQGLLTLDWTQRMTCAQALEHPWIKKGGAAEEEFRSHYFTEMNKQQNKVKLRTAVERMLINKMNKRDADVLKSRISKFGNNSGLIDSSAVMNALDNIRKSIRVSFAFRRPPDPVSSFRSHNSISPPLSPAMSPPLTPTSGNSNASSGDFKITGEDEEVIRMLFESLDHDESGNVDPEVLSKALLSQIDEDPGSYDWDEASRARGMSRKKLQSNLLQEVFQESDVDGDGKISINEFLSAMTSAFKSQ